MADQGPREGWADRPPALVLPGVDQVVVDSRSFYMCPVRLRSLPRFALRALLFPRRRANRVPAVSKELMAQASVHARGTYESCSGPCLCSLLAPSIICENLFLPILALKGFIWHSGEGFEDEDFKGVLSSRHVVLSAGRRQVIGGGAWERCYQGHAIRC